MPRRSLCEVVFFVFLFFSLSLSGQIWQANPNDPPLGAALGLMDEREVLEANPPTDLSIRVVNQAVVLTWTQMPNAAEYVVESSSQYESGYSVVTWQGSFSSQGNTISWSRRLSGDQKFYRVKSVRADLTGNLVMVQGGTFNNGTSDISLSSFLMDKYEVTQASYQAVMGNNPSNSYGVGSNYPVYFVTWFNAIEYCNKRSISEGFSPCYSYSTYGTNPASWPSGWNTNAANHTNIACNWNVNGYRLPTEMEWHFAAGGGNLTHDYIFSGSDNINDVGWYDGNNSPNGSKQIGTKLPNELALFDMSGNVWEWCWDIFGDMSFNSQTNPHGALTGTFRSLQGGSWYGNSQVCSVNFRGYCSPTDNVNNNGFRVCRSIPQQAPSQMVYVNGGTFNNGTSTVTLSSYLISDFETTQDEYQSVMGFNPAQFTDVTDAPVEQVTWFKAVEYCNRRSMQENLTPCYSYASNGTNPSNWPSGWDAADANHLNVTCNWSANGYRLPSEAEWEFAARGGNLTHNYTYSGSNDVNAVAWYESNSGGTSHTVGTKYPNELNLYDMSGNVYEWVWDILGGYPTGGQTNPHGPSSGDSRVFRGGGWYNNAFNQTVSNRPNGLPSTAWFNLGFRVCRNTGSWVYIPEGTYNNGTADIHLSPYYMFYIEVGQPSYTSITGKTPAWGYGAGAEYPAYSLSWFDAIEYCNLLSVNQNLSPCYSYGSYGQTTSNWPAGWNTNNANRANVNCDWTANGYRLPTEAEWEYAARGGNLSHNYSYSGSNDINSVAWYTGNSSGITHACGGKAQNELGIYDMSGNVWEWCWDYYSAEQNPGVFVDPHGPLTGTYAIIRGGAWLSDASNCVISRRTCDLILGSGYEGIRLCRNDFKPVADPVFSVGGGTYYVPTSVTLTSNTFNASFRYTTDGTTPSPTHGTVYTGPINITDSMTLKAIAYKSGRTSSEIVEATYVMYLTVADPDFDPEAGTYPSPITVVIATTTAEATIRYTTDGSTPSQTHGTVYSTPVQVSATQTIKAIACRTSWTSSGVSEATYTINLTVSNPVFSPPEGTYQFPFQPVVISTTTPGASIRYTTDGTDPTPTHGTLYSSSIILYSTTIFKAMAYRDGWADSGISTGIFVVTRFIPVTGGTFNNGVADVTLSSFHIGAHEITQAQYQSVMNENPSIYTGDPNRPVDRVSMYHAIAYCNRRSMMEGRNPVYEFTILRVISYYPYIYYYQNYGTDPGFWPQYWDQGLYNSRIWCTWEDDGYRLPTEMEWMYAAQGGCLSQGYLYSGSNDVNTVAWYSENSDSSTQRVGVKDSNELGIYDMSGNVSELCWDDWTDTLPSTPQTDPHSEGISYTRTVRGGNISGGAGTCETTYRTSLPMYSWGLNNGFRICYRGTSPTTATPVIDPPGGVFADQQLVTITCATPNAAIYYTLDGTVPTTASPQFTQPFMLTQSATVKARAFYSNYFASEVASAEFTIGATIIPVPIISPASGSYPGPLQVTIDGQGGNVYYSVDGTDPTDLSINYAGPFNLTHSTTIKARSYTDPFTFSEVTVATYTITTPIPTGYATVEGGTFHNGSANVTISGFELDKYEVTQADYYTIMGVNPSAVNTIGPAYPVCRVSWTKAIEYCNRKSILENLTPCYSYSTNGTNPANWPVGWDTGADNHLNISCNWNADGYRLPTEMEWMFAAKGGALTPAMDYDTWSGTSIENELVNYVWYYYNTFSAQQIGGRLPNQLGLYDMSGNQYEWVWDIFGDYPTTPTTNPTGPSVGTNRTVRGGCWSSFSEACRIDFRLGINPTLTTSQEIGFRIGRIYPEVASPVIDPPGGNFTSTQVVSITCSTPNAEIRYTVDNSEPNTSSQLYSGPFSVNAPTVLKTKAFVTSLTPSATTTGVFNFTPGWALVHGGSFNMGDTRGGGASDQLPVHQVNLSPFFLSNYEVTQSEWENLMGTGVMNSHTGDYGEEPNYPMYWVTWYQILVYCNTRSIAEGFTPVYTINGSTNPSSWGSVPSSNNANWNAVTCNWSANGYRLPTEAEWEYAARGAAHTPDYLYSGSDNIDTVSWYDGNNTPYGNKAVGTKAPNALGIYDMSGSVWEWCWDRYGAYTQSTQTNPTGPTTGTNHTMRGGSWYDGTDASRVSYRYNVHPWGGYFCIGFRLARSYSAPQVALPVFDPAGGSYTNSQSVSITCATPGATIRYTLDGSDPSESSNLYSTPINISANKTLKARAYKSGWTTSNIASASYIINTSFVLVEGGTFNNGTSNVTVSSFLLDKHELTQENYQAVMGSNPSTGFGVSNNTPVYFITWFNTIEYCNKRSLLEGLTPCYSYSTYGTNPSKWPAGWNTSEANHNNVSCNWSAGGYRLLSEMEWQFAARGGTLSNNYTYSGSNNLDSVAWHGANSGGITHPVAAKTPNELGLYDMSGNTWEWVWDIYEAYPTGDQTNPHGPSSGTNRIVRGGSWADYNTSSLEVAFRISIGTYTTYNNVGFRVCRNAP